MASMSHALTLPKSTVLTPIRPLTAAVGAAASSCAMRLVTVALMPVADSTSSGVNAASSVPSSSTPDTFERTWSPTSTSPSAYNTLIIAAKNNPSVPGRIEIHSSASSAVRVRRGSTTTTLPPRVRIASSRPGKSGAVQTLPFDAYGLVPNNNR